ncbi:transmembrane protein, putative [Medicago truncatula]|uniref:Transmembrane protein, putative n=1 Tax=Medicago truncatula TaxID=3880 RepID=A0A072UZ86_MEDTR|nr:transmembrane protein, putative [Medicago truncatula]
MKKKKSMLPEFGTLRSKRTRIHLVWTLPLYSLSTLPHNLNFSVFLPKPATLIHGVQKFWELTLMNKGMDDLRLSNP